MNTKPNPTSQRSYAGTGDLIYVRLPCGMRIGTPHVQRPSRFQGMKNSIKKTFKRIMEF